MNCPCGKVVPDSRALSAIRDTSRKLVCNRCGRTWRADRGWEAQETTTEPTVAVPAPTSTTELETCEKCGQTIKPLNPHRIDAAKIQVLADTAKLQRETKSEWVKFFEGHDIEAGGVRAKTAYRASQHIQRLKWFGLADYRGKRSGEYSVNEDGFLFLTNRLQVPSVIWCRGGRVVERSTTLIGINDVRDVILDKAYWDNYASVQKPASVQP